MNLLYPLQHTIARGVCDGFYTTDLLMFITLQHTTARGGMGGILK